MCKIHQRKYEGLANDLLRIDASMKGIAGPELISYFMKPPPNVSSMIQEERDIEIIDDMTKVVYWKFKMPLMSARDSCMKITQSNQGDGTFFVCETIERPDVPEVKGVVRMFVYTRGYVRPNKELPDTIDYTEMTVMNMGGYMPARLLNMVLASEREKEFR
jgi:hypothetical protein